MLTTDPLYWKPYKPQIRLYTTHPTAATLQYKYDPFSGTGQVTTGPSTSIPSYLNIQLSQNTHGTFIAQFLEDSRAMENADITAGSRIQVFAGKASNIVYLTFGGIVRQVGYDLGPDEKILYTLVGSGYGIRLNERVIYESSEAARSLEGAMNMSDASRKADTLLESTLGPILDDDGLISTTNLASSSDVETFIPSTQVEYGECQDYVNLIEESSGGTVVITPTVTGTSIMQLKHENAVGAYGYTVKNKHPSVSGAKDDADDTLYMLDKNRSFLKQFDKATNYSNRVYGIFAANPGITTDHPIGAGFGNWSDLSFESAWKFKPDHSRFVPGDVYFAGRSIIGADATPRNIIIRIAGPDTSDSPSSLPVVVNIKIPLESFPNAFATEGTAEEVAYAWVNDQQFFDISNAEIYEFFLDTTKYYWFILTNRNMTTSAPSVTTAYFRWDLVIGGSVPWGRSPSTFTSSNSNSGAGWTTSSSAHQPAFQLPRQRAYSMVMWDPKAIYAVSSGLTNGLFVDNVLVDAPNFITTRDQLLKYEAIQLYEQSKPRMQVELPILSAPNIPVFPGDVLVINDTVLGYTQPANQALVLTAGDMMYNWGSRGGPGLEYEGATKISIAPVGIYPGYS